MVTLEDFENPSSKGKEAKYLTNLFLENKVDTSNIRPAYIRSVKSKHPIFEGFSDSRFVVNYRKLLSAYLIGKGKTGARKVENSPRLGEEEEEKESDDDEEE